MLSPNPNESMREVYIGVGSNLADPIVQVRRAGSYLHTLAETRVDCLSRLGSVDEEVGIRSAVIIIIVRRGNLGLLGRV